MVQQKLFSHRQMHIMSKSTAEEITSVGVARSDDEFNLARL